MSERLIKTQFVRPAIPDRRFDWTAWYDDIGPEEVAGWGPSETAAIANLRMLGENLCPHCRRLDPSTCRMGGCPIGADL